jgi:hypothetical protein
VRPAIRDRRGTPFLAAALLAVTGLGTSVPAGAAPVDRDPACADGTVPQGSARTERPEDGRSYTAAQLRRIDRRLQDRLAEVGAGRTAAGATLRIAVHVHVVAGDQSKGASKRQVRRQLEVLDAGYAGGQSATNAVTRFDFYLASFERVRRDSWHNARIGGQADVDMRRALHRGGPQDLNLYVLEPRDPYAQNVVLGWATPPAQARKRTDLDGVVLHQESLPGGSFNSYNRGDTAVHEVGHWLGLFHTFEGGCEGPGDLVEDTPAQSVASSACDPAKDSCIAQPGLDPVNNFMDYSVDDCMNMFTPGQVSRMHDNWLAYRTP